MAIKVLQFKNIEKRHKEKLRKIELPFVINTEQEASIEAFNLWYKTAIETKIRNGKMGIIMSDDNPGLLWSFFPNNTGAKPIGYIDTQKFIDIFNNLKKLLS